MSAAKLFEDLINLPIENNEFDQIKCIKLEKFDDEESYDADSFGSCCSSPTQSSGDCSSPTNSSECTNSSPTNEHSDNDYFTFAAASEHTTGKKKQTKLENKVKRNERERRRVRRLAEGFRKLRTVVPGESKKLSKLQTLQQALQYMADLVDMVSLDNPHIAGNRLEECQAMEDQMYSPQEYASYQQQMASTKALSHPPINWPYSPINQNQQQQQIIYPMMDPNLYTPNMDQQQVPVWYFT